ncbi:MAG: response regulator [Planctomycetaceae bacterium]
MTQSGTAREVVILFVDDSATDRTRGVGLLRKQRPEWEIVDVPSASDGLNELGNREIDVVVTDLVMPEMDGRQFLQAVMERYPTIPVVLVTSQGSDQIAAQSMELGAVNYVPKRRLSEDLVPALEDILKAGQDSSKARDVLRHVIRNRSLFSIDNDLEQIRSLVHLVRTRLHSLHRLRADTVASLTAAVREALLNAYFHGNLEIDNNQRNRSADDFVEQALSRSRDSRFAGRQIELEMHLEPGELRFRIADEGRGFNASEVIARVRQSDPATTSGLHVICGEVDDVSFNDTGNQITLTKTLRSTASERCRSNPELNTAPAE